MSRLQCAIDAINEAVQPSADYSQLLVAAKARGLMKGYEARWARLQDQFDVIAVEDFIQSDLWNPETGKKSRTFLVAGKLDVRAMRGGRNVIVDHKTCSEDITDPDATYWRQLTIESQPSHYMLLEWLNGRKIDEAIWDVVRKPTISPKKLTAAEQKQVFVTGNYFGHALTMDEQLALQADGRESLAMYEARLTHDCTNERPEWYFQRRSVPRLDMEIQEYASDLWADGQELLHVRKTEHHRKNPGACMNYGRPCRYLGICSNHDTPDSSNWTRKENVHVELPMLQGDSRSFLTNSRLSTFRTCRRKHLYDYELGLKRVDEEEAESLYFGNTIHKALEIWWGFDMPAVTQTQKETEHVNDADNSAGSELAAASAS